MIIIDNYRTFARKIYAKPNRWPRTWKHVPLTEYCVCERERVSGQIQHSIDHRPLTFSHIASIQFQLDWFANDDVNNRNVCARALSNTTHFIAQLDCDWIYVITLIRFLVHITSIVVILITKANYCCNNRINTWLSAFWYRFCAINSNAQIALDWIDLTSFSSV